MINCQFLEIISAKELLRLVSSDRSVTYLNIDKYQIFLARKLLGTPVTHYENLRMYAPSALNHHPTIS